MKTTIIKITTQLNEDGILSTKRGKEDEDDEEADRIYNEIENYNPKRKSPNNKMTEPS